MIDSLLIIASFSTIWNHIRLKHIGNGTLSVSRFSTIWNHIRLKPQNPHVPQNGSRLYCYHYIIKIIIYDNLFFIKQQTIGMDVI